MNIIVLHGDHLSGSLKRLEKFIDVAHSRGWEIVRIEPADKGSLQETLTSESLFQKERLFVLEKPTTLGKKDLGWLREKTKALQGNLVIYHQDTLKKEFLFSLPKGIKIEEFKLPENIFDFLDSFSPGNSKKSIKILHSLLGKEPVEFIFALLARHLRDLYLAKVAPQKLWYQPWRVQKLKRQASLFKEDQLKEIIFSLAEADIAAKTSQVSLGDSLDLLIATKLE